MNEQINNFDSDAESSYKKASERVFNIKKQVASISLLALPGAEELGEKIDYYLTRWWNQAMEDYRSEHSENPFHTDDESVDTFLVPVECPRFSSGDGKGIIKKSIRGDDVYIIVDVGNYAATYELFGNLNHMSPDDHYQNLKRIIQAASGKAHRINLIMPILYGGRQHRRNFRESLDCAVALQELQAMGVENIITFDAHDPRVCNAIPLMGFDSIIPSYQVLKAMFAAIDGFAPDKEHFMIISPDEGAMSRNMYYASVLGVDLGMFYKRRDYSQLVKGRNPIVAHEYLGNSVEGKDVFVADDIISSGESMIDVATELKKRGARRVFAFATYPLFTNGLEKFDEAVKNGDITKIFGTNFTYRTEELKSREWYVDIDASKYTAYLIAALNHDISTSKVIDPHEKIKELFKKHGMTMHD